MAPMLITASFTDVRRDLTTITEKVITDGVQVTVFKRNKPAFKIVPVEPPTDMQLAYLAANTELDREYLDVFEELAQ